MCVRLVNETNQMEAIELTIVALSESLSQPGNYALILEDMVSQRRVPLIIGPAEARAIAMAIEKMTPYRPQTHDLFFQTLERLNTHPTSVEIHRVGENSVFFAYLHLNTPSGPVSIDARPSDAIALAVRAGCSIFMNKTVLDISGYYPDDTARALDGFYAACTLTELDDLLDNTLKKEDYESAALVRDAIERRK
ncbi:bifunctional nuclease family protein [Spirosoma sp. KCTC 42546]|uniref:bifunctional nuclease family protein n=1 Tax=Spirosoma sp. KCTC 42546 TaxID=2520506 RepID=UPI001FEF9D90|nr:bifunctional nuclease family protein [Spirosoma sp. KCTC 42546]